MKRITLTAVILSLFTTLAFADRFETLAGYRDEITLKSGEAALVTFVTDAPTLQYQKKGKRPVQMQLGLTRRNQRHYSNYSYGARIEKNPSADQPLALTGPATVKLVTDGVVSLRVITNK